MRSEIVWDAASLSRLKPSRIHRLVPGRPVEDVLSLAIETARAFAAARKGTLPRDAEARVEVLRSALVAANDERYAEARAAVADLAEADEVVLALLAAAFTAETAWTARAMRAHLDRGARPARLTELLGPFLTDPGASTELAILTAPSPRALWPHALDVVAHLGEAAVAPLRAMLLHRFSDSSMDGVARALGRIGTEPAGRVLLPLAAVRRLRPRARSWARRYPDLAIPLLRSLIDAPTEEALDLAESHDIASSLEALLGELVPRPAAVGEEVWPAATPAVLREGHPPRPRFLVAQRLPRIALADGSELPPSATERLAAALAAGDHAALAAIRSTCRPDRLASLALALLEQWLAHGADPREGWAIDALGVLGRDTQIEGLLPYLAEWQGRGAAARAGRLLDAIAAMGTERALLELDRVARKDRYRRLRTRAREAVAKAGAALGLSGDELEDRLAPTLGLDPTGRLVLDLGAHALEVRFDEHLRPRLLEEGRERNRFPPRRRGDDPERWAAAKARFADLRRQAARVADQQVARLERMMVLEREVSWADFDTCFMKHPLVGHLVRRLIWATDERRFRVTDDGTLADLDDAPLPMPEVARVRLVHPLGLPEPERAAWAEVLADYELTQPFEQLGRRLVTATPDERAAKRLLRLEAREVPWPAVQRLVHAGFVASTRDGLRYTVFEGSVFDRPVRLEVTPGLHVGEPTGSGAQRVVAIDIPDLDRLSDVLASEVSRAILEPLEREVTRAEA
ncbi:MAG: DUF4132 domain-containing protein [Sandaracinaceae bacterium]